MKQQNEIPLLDCPVDYIVGDATGSLLNKYGRFPCKIKCGVYAFMVSGHASATVNIEKYQFNKGDLIIIEPNTFLLIHDISQDALVYYIVLSSAFLEKHVFGPKISFRAIHWTQPNIPLKQDVQGVYKSMMELLMQASNCEPSMLTVPVMVHFFNVILQFAIDITQIAEAAQPRQHSRKQELVRQFSDLVIANYQKEHQLAFYANALHVTLPHLCTTVKDITNKTAASFITDAILTDAKAQLKITNLSVKEIAVSLGFDNVMFFNKYFKSHVGIGPKAYRNG